MTLQLLMHEDKMGMEMCVCVNALTGWLEIGDTDGRPE